MLEVNAGSNPAPGAHLIYMSTERIKLLPSPARRILEELLQGPKTLRELSNALEEELAVTSHYLASVEDVFPLKRTYRILQEPRAGIPERRAEQYELHKNDRLLAHLYLQ